MSNVPTDLKYTQEHEWVRAEKGEATVGITDFAQRQLGDVVFVELTETSSALEAGEPFGTVESVKAVSELFMPVSGTIAAANRDALNEEPELVNTDPYDEGWMVRIKLSNPKEIDGLMSAAKYEEYISAEEGG